MDGKAEFSFTFEQAINRLSNYISIHSKRTLLNYPSVPAPVSKLGFETEHIRSVVGQCRKQTFVSTGTIPLLAPLCAGTSAANATAVPTQPGDTIKLWCAGTEAHDGARARAFTNFSVDALL